MLEQIAKDIVEAMKNREKMRLDSLRYLKSMLMENSTSKQPKAESEVIAGHYKKLKDSLQHFPKDSELFIKTEQELIYVAHYMPKPLSEVEVEELISKMLKEGVEKNFGSIMKLLSPQIKGRFDGKKASELVKKLLV